MAEQIPEYAKTLTLPSGFTVAITPIPPYYADIVEDMYPEREYPGRTITLLAGDTYTEPYEPPEEPDHDNVEEYGLWLKWHEVDEFNKRLKQKKSRLKRDLSLSLCVHIVDGPVDIDDEEWMLKLEAPFVEEGREKSVLLEHKGQKRLLFLKYVVITDLQSYELIMREAIFEEVSMQGITRALHNFRGDVGQDGSS